MNYDEYHLSRREYLVLALQAAACGGAFSYVFYRHIIAFLLFLPLVFFYPFLKKKDLIPARKRKLLLEFREALGILSGALSAGYSPENAVTETVRELRLLYDARSLIVNEFEQIEDLVAMNVPLERAVDDFAARSGLEDIRNFARVLRIAKRSGGELVSIMNHTAGVISDKIAVREEILTLTASRRFEQNIMNLVPLLIVLYVDMSSPGFFSVMYTTLTGRLVMTGCLVTYLGAVALSRKILSIEL